MHSQHAWMNSHVSPLGLSLGTTSKQIATGIWTDSRHDTPCQWLRNNQQCYGWSNSGLLAGHYTLLITFYQASVEVNLRSECTDGHQTAVPDTENRGNCCGHVSSWLYRVDILTQPTCLVKETLVDVNSQYIITQACLIDSKHLRRNKRLLPIWARLLFL